MPRVYHDFDHAFWDWWKNGGTSPAHQKWSCWYFDQLETDRNRPYDYVDRAWQQRFEEMKSSILQAIRREAPKR